MKYFIPALIIFMALHIISGAQERQVVATVDSSPIYLDEIGVSKKAQEGEIKFVDPDVNPKETNKDAQIQLLKTKIADKIIRTEIKNRAISPSNEAVQKEVNAYAEQQWSALFPNEEKKKEVLTRMQLSGLKILEGLTIWKQNKTKGNEFAKNNLEPLGMTREAWAFYTDNAEDPEIIGKLKKWEDIDSMSREEIKEFLFLTKNKDHINNIRYILSKEMLKNQVTQGSKPSPEETKRLYELLQNTKNIDIVIIPKGAPELKELKALERFKRKSSLPKKYQSKVLSLPRSNEKAKGKANPSLKEYMVLATHADSLEPGAISSVVDWPKESKGPKSFVIFIYDRTPKQAASPADKKTLTELSKELQQFNRDLEFSNWLQSEITLRTEILIPEYQKAISR